MFAKSVCTGLRIHSEFLLIVKVELSRGFSDPEKLLTSRLESLRGHAHKCLDKTEGKGDNSHWMTTVSGTIRVGNLHCPFSFL